MVPAALAASLSMLLGSGATPQPVYLRAHVLQLTERTRTNHSRARHHWPGGIDLTHWFYTAKQGPAPCSEETVAPFEEWQGAGHDMKQMWETKQPEAAIYIEQLDDVCQATAGRSANVLTIVAANEAPRCQAKEERHGQEYVAIHDNSISQVSDFITPVVLPAGGSIRKYVTAWPSRRACSAAEKCPVVVSLHGHGEHSSPDLLQAWGFLNYLYHDEGCRATLGSVLVFPQLMDGENWVENAHICIEHFVLPLLDHLDKSTSSLDLGRVAIMGYSEGGVGALQAAILFPNMFTVVASGSPVLPATMWSTLSVQPQSSDPHKLHLIAVGFGEKDPMGDMPTSLGGVIDMLAQSEVLEHGVLQMRLYANTNHINTYESLFNNWGKLHQVLWEGNYSAMGL